MGQAHIRDITRDMNQGSHGVVGRLPARFHMALQSEGAQRITTALSATIGGNVTQAVISESGQEIPGRAGITGRQFERHYNARRDLNTTSLTSMILDNTTRESVAYDLLISNGDHTVMSAQRTTRNNGWRVENISGTAAALHIRNNLEAQLDRDEPMRIALIRRGFTLPRELQNLLPEGMKDIHDLPDGPSGSPMVSNGAQALRLPRNAALNASSSSVENRPAGP